ncbi:MAG: META domain-containing protein [Pseudorhodoplanes sp.]
MNVLSTKRLLLSCAVLAGALHAVPASAADAGFPFEQEFLLDAKPLRGTKRMPTLEVGSAGGLALDLWCSVVKGQAIVVNDTITIMAGPKTERNCPADQSREDDALLAALADVDRWRREGNDLILVGPKTLRFRVPTN